MPFTRERDDGADLRDLVAEFEEVFFLHRDGLLDGHRVAVALVQYLDDAARGHAPEFVKHRLGKIRRARAERGLPGAVVRGHGVGEGAIAVEDECGEIALRKLQGKRRGGRKVTHKGREDAQVFPKGEKDRAAIARRAAHGGAAATAPSLRFAHGACYVCSPARTTPNFPGDKNHRCAPVKSQSPHGRNQIPLPRMHAKDRRRGIRRGRED